MEIPEVTADQIELLYQVALNPSFYIFAQHLSRPDDIASDKANWDKKNADALYLCSIGMLKNISAENPAHLEAQKEKTGRDWMLFEVPRLTQQMFGIRHDRSIH